MDHEFIDSKNDMFAERDDTYSSIKHEFSRIFHENNLHSFTNASDIGFIDLGKPPTHKFSGDYDDLQGQNDMGNMMGRSYYREEPSPRNYMGMNMQHSYSPMTFLQSNLPQSSHYNTGYQNMMNVPQKGVPLQDPALYLSYPSYQQYADYGYSDYSTQPNSAYPQNYYDGYDHSDIVDTHHNNALSLMWSNETGKNTGSVKVSEEPVPALSQAALNKRFSAAPVEDLIPKKPNALKVEQDLDKSSNRTLSAQLERASKTTASESNAAPRRTTRNIKSVYNNASFAGEEEDSGSDDDKDEAYGNTKSRSSRGLRVLSLKVRDIVAKKKKTSYKEVADALLEDLSQKLKGKSESEISKEEQNVKRRVYDALNVLIAADVLRKEGKFVCLTGSASNSGSNKKSGGKDKDDLLQQIQELKKRRKEKMEALQELVFKSLAIKNLVRKNKEKADLELVIGRANGMPGMNGMNGVKSVKGHQNVTPRYPPALNAAKIDVTQNNPTLNQKNQDIIHFPFIVLKSTSPENSMNLDMEASQRQLSIESRKPFEIFGDIDILLKMRLHYVPRQMFEKDVPKELQKYITQTFINALN